MTLPSSGALSMSAINAEFGRGNNLNAYRGTTWYTDAGSSGTFTSSNLGFDQFYGKRATSPTFSFTISSNQTNANLRTLAVNAGWNQSSALVATISSGVYISSNSTGTPALTVSGSFPGGVTLVNNGYIIGSGGNGGAGRSVSGTTGSGGSNGSSGGLALSVSSSVSINNAGTIGGGGGGGGGGAGRYYYYVASYETQISNRAGSGGGGGRSSYAANSSGGAAGTTSGGNYAQYGSAGAGGSGTYSSAGSGGSAHSYVGIVGGVGGAGGSWGAAGSSGNSGSGGTGQAGTPLSGGAAGGAVSGNGYISWIATGTRLGSIS